MVLKSYDKLNTEPTSGLDSFTAISIVRLLKRLSRRGRTIIFTIHQPSSDIFAAFDRLILMVKGKQIYQVPFNFLNISRDMDVFALSISKAKVLSAQDFQTQEISS
jgi:ABC-type multidrug transport system ATPase subunit